MCTLIYVHFLVHFGCAFPPTDAAKHVLGLLGCSMALGSSVKGEGGRDIEGHPQAVAGIDVEPDDVLTLKVLLGFWLVESC